MVAIKVTPSTRAVAVAPVRCGSRLTFSPASLAVAYLRAKGRVNRAVNAGNRKRQIIKAAHIRIKAPAMAAPKVISCCSPSSLPRLFQARTQSPLPDNARNAVKIQWKICSLGLPFLLSSWVLSAAIGRIFPSPKVGRKAPISGTRIPVTRDRATGKIPITSRVCDREPIMPVP